MSTMISVNPSGMIDNCAPGSDTDTPCASSQPWVLRASTAEAFSCGTEIHPSTQ